MSTSDMAIDGNGFFVVKTAARTFTPETGHFSQDTRRQAGYLQRSFSVMGYPAIERRGEYECAADGDQYSADGPSTAAESYDDHQHDCKSGFGWLRTRFPATCLCTTPWAQPIT